MKGESILDVQQTTLRIPKKLFQFLKTKAKAKGVSLNALILHILWEYAEKQEPIKERNVQK